VLGVRVDKELKKQFIRVSKAKFGSCCNPIESFMAAVVGCSNVGVSPSITIGDIRIERNLRERRKLETETYDGVAERTVSVTCGFNDCTEKAIAEGFYKGEKYLLCSLHLSEIRENRFWHDVKFLVEGAE